MIPVVGQKYHESVVQFAVKGDFRDDVVDEIVDGQKRLPSMSKRFVYVKQRLVAQRISSLAQKPVLVFPVDAEAGQALSGDVGERVVVPRRGEEGSVWHQ